MLDEEAVFAYLEDLRESGEINMAGAPTFVMVRFGISREQARDYFNRWRKSKEEGA